MKKFLVVICLASCFIGFSQENEKIDFGRNEIKGNALLLIAGAAEFTYERLLNEESGVGITFSKTYDNDLAENFNITPYYRFYFGAKPAAGFFVEGFGMLNSYKVETYPFENNMNSSNNPTIVNKTDFALGFGLGAKWITRKGFLFELNGGIGRNLSRNNDSDLNNFVGRGGITLGYRFK